MRTPTKAILLSIALIATPVAAQAESRALQQSRFINGTVGAVAGALVGGPIGLIAGAAIGYTIGPEIAGPNPRLITGRKSYRRSARRRGRATPAVYQQATQPAPYGYPQQVPAGYPAMQPAYPQQPMYLAPTQGAAQAYQPYPAQQPQQVAPIGQPMRQSFNPRQNAMVPSPEMMGGGIQYSAVAGQAPQMLPPGGNPAMRAYNPFQQRALPSALAAPVPLPR